MKLHIEFNVEVPESTSADELLRASLIKIYEQYNTFKNFNGTGRSYTEDSNDLLLTINEDGYIQDWSDTIKDGTKEKN